MNQNKVHRRNDAFSWQTSPIYVLLLKPKQPEPPNQTWSRLEPSKEILKNPKRTRRGASKVSSTATVLTDDPATAIAYVSVSVPARERKR